MPAQVEAWEERRISVLSSLPEQEAAEDRIELLSEQLDQARTTIDGLRGKEHDLRDRLERVDHEKAALVDALNRERAGNSRSQDRVAELTARVSAVTQQAEVLKSTLQSVIERYRRAEVTVANLRAELSQLEAELLFESVGATRPRGTAPAGRTRSNTSPVSAGSPGSAITGLQEGLSHQIGRTEQIRAGLIDARTEMQVVAAELLRILDGSSADVLSALGSTMDKSYAELDSALRATTEFLDGAEQLVVGSGRIAIVTEEAQRSAGLIAELLSTVLESRKDVEALMGSHRGYAHLLEVVSVLVNRLDDCQELGLHTVRLIEEYRSSL